MDEQHRDAELAARIRDIERLQRQLGRMEEEKKNSDAAAEILTDFIQAGHAEMLDGGGVRLSSGVNSNDLAQERQRSSLQPAAEGRGNRREVMVLANAHLQQEPAQEEQVEDPDQMQWESLVNQDAPLLNRALWECSYLKIPP